MITIKLNNISILNIDLFNYGDRSNQKIYLELKNTHSYKSKQIQISNIDIIESSQYHQNFINNECSIDTHKYHYATRC